MGQRQERARIAVMRGDLASVRRANRAHADSGVAVTRHGIHENHAVRRGDGLGQFRGELVHRQAPHARPPPPGYGPGDQWPRRVITARMRCWRSCGV
jgi:hypothetical protein